MSEEGGPEINPTPKPESAPLDPKKEALINRAIWHYDNVKEDSRSLAEQDINYSENVKDKMSKLQDDVRTSDLGEAWREGIISKTEGIIAYLKPKIEMFEDQASILAGPDIGDRNEMLRYLNQAARTEDPVKAHFMAEAALQKFIQVSGLIVSRRNTQTEVVRAMSNRSEEDTADAKEIFGSYIKENPTATNEDLLAKYYADTKDLAETLADRPKKDKEFSEQCYKRQEAFEEALRELVKKE